MRYDHCKLVEHAFAIQFLAAIVTGPEIVQPPAPAVCYTGIVQPAVESSSDYDFDLRFELGLVREVMRRLLRLWDKQGDAIASEEARWLAGLLFNGARTVAVMLYQQSRRGGVEDEFPNWLNGALEALGQKYDLNL